MKTPTFRIVALDTFLSELLEAPRRGFLRELRSTWGTHGDLPSHVLVMNNHHSPLSAKIVELFSLLRNAQLHSVGRSESQEDGCGVHIEFRDKAVLANGSQLDFRDKGCRGLFRFAFLHRRFSLSALLRVLELWLEDISSNGSFRRLPDGGWARLPSRTPVLVKADDLLRFGDVQVCVRQLST